MGGRLSLTMHGASVGSWGNPAKPRIKPAGHERPGETSPSAELDTAANGAPTDVSVRAGTRPRSVRKPPLPPKR